MNGRLSTTVSILIVGAAISMYLFTKATISSFTHDESYTYLRYPHDSFVKIISFGNWFMNNHILNSLFMKYSEILFGNSEIALRLPNLLALLVFLFYSCRLFKHKHPLLRVAIFILLCSNVVLMDMFGLARGYGLSFCFMLMSVYHFNAYMHKPDRIDLYGFHLAALLATLSHFTLLPFYIALMIVFNLIKLIHTRHHTDSTFNLFKINRPHIIPVMVNMIILYEPVRRALTYGQLNVGGKGGFYEDTVNSFVMYISNGTIGAEISFIFQIIATLIVLIPFIVIIRSILVRNNILMEQYRGLVISTFLLLLISGMIVLNHYATGSDYPIGRFLLFLIPLFIIHVGFLVEYLMAGSFKTAALLLTCAGALVGSISFTSKVNLREYEEWKYDAKTKNMILDLIDYRLAMNDESVNVRIGSDWIFEPTINFYREVYDLNWLLHAHRNGIRDQDHYIYAFGNVLDTLDASKYEVIRRYNETNTVLLRNRDVANQ